MLICPRWALPAGAVLVLALLVSVLMVRRAGSDGAGGPRRRAETDAPPPAGPLPALARPRVVVEKSAGRLILYDGRTPIRTWRASVGTGRGDKRREGDRCTPEGRFYVCFKNPRSRFTRSLGLSYPNVEDADRGLRDGLIDRATHAAIADAIGRRARPPWKPPLGGEIMIHGGGGGRDWTIGCVAVDDPVILQLYEALPVGTPVEILP